MELFLPRKVTHLAKVSENVTCCHGATECLTCFATNAGFVRAPARINNGELNEIVVSPQMGTGHFPNWAPLVAGLAAASCGVRHWLEQTSAQKHHICQEQKFWRQRVAGGELKCQKSAEDPTHPLPRRRATRNC